VTSTLQRQRYYHKIAFVYPLDVSFIWIVTANTEM